MHLKARKSVPDCNSKVFLVSGIVNANVKPTDVVLPSIGHPPNGQLVLTAKGSAYFQIRMT